MVKVNIEYNNVGITMLVKCWEDSAHRLVRFIVVSYRVQRQQLYCSRIPDRPEHPSDIVDSSESTHAITDPGPHTETQ